MADPNNCATCEHRKYATDANWCYMFREQPAPLCMQHQDRKPKRVGTIGHVHHGAAIGLAVASILARQAGVSLDDAAGVNSSTKEQP